MFLKAAGGEFDRRPGGGFHRRSQRATLVQCAWVSRGPRGDAKLREVYERLYPRIGKKRAIVAVTRRLAIRLRAKWLEALKTSEEAEAAVAEV